MMLRIEEGEKKITKLHVVVAVTGGMGGGLGGRGFGEAIKGRRAVRKLEREKER